MGLDTSVSIQTQQQFFLQQLKTHTASAHTRLEQSPLSVNLLRPGVTITEYGSYLAYMQAIIAWHEAHTFPTLIPLFPDMGTRYKLHLLKSDLECLRQKEIIQYAPSYVLAEDEHLNIPCALGYMYVIEGSTLGGRIILHHINETLGFDENNGAQFFAGYGNQTGKQWKRFLEIFASYAVTNHCGDEIISAAADAFTSIQQHFAQSAEI
jgi:heme oxygenase